MKFYYSFTSNVYPGTCIFFLNLYSSCWILRINALEILPLISFPRIHITPPPQISPVLHTILSSRSSFFVGFLFRPYFRLYRFRLCGKTANGFFALIDVYQKFCGENFLAHLSWRMTSSGGVSRAKNFHYFFPIPRFLFLRIPIPSPLSLFQLRYALSLHFQRPHPRRSLLSRTFVFA